MQKNIKAIIFIILFSVLSFNFSIAMLPGTKVLMGDGGHKKVEDLKAGDLVGIYSIKDKTIEIDAKEIEKIQTKKTNKLVVIKTKAGVCIYGLKQRIYNRKICKFVRASELKEGDVIFSPELGNLVIEDIFTEKIDKKIKLYDIAIKDKCLFLALMDDENHILFHNEPVTLTLFTISWGVGGVAVKWLGGTTLAVFAGKILADIVKKKLEKEGVDTSGFGIEDSFPSLFENESGGGNGGKGPNDDDDDDKPTEGDSCNITSGTSKAPKTSEPDSGHYKLDNADKTTVESKTVYNSEGKPATRADINTGNGKYRSHHIKEGKSEKGHVHTFKYNEKGQRIEDKVTPLN